MFCATVDYHFKLFHMPYIKWFKEQGWEVHVAASGSLPLSGVDHKFDLPIERSPFHLNNRKAYKQLKSIIDQNNYQMIHCHTPMGGIIARLAARSAQKQGTKVIYTAHGFHFCKGAPMINWLVYYPIELTMARYTDCLITINEEDYQLAAQRFKAKQVKHVHGVGINTNRFKPIDEYRKKERKKSFGYDPDDFLLFYAAEFNKNKNQQFLINCLAMIKEDIPNAKLLLAGEGKLLDSCRELAAKLDVTHMVNFLGFRDDLDQLLPMCDAAVASSLREGLPVNIMEAMACGLPVVAVDNRGHRELVKDNINGWVLEPGNKEVFAEKVKTLYQSKIICDNLGKSARELINKYTIPEVSKELEVVYSRFMLEASYGPQNKYNRAHI